jgi:ribose transport system substrate-binding protein
MDLPDVSARSAPSPGQSKEERELMNQGRRRLVPVAVAAAAASLAIAACGSSSNSSTTSSSAAAPTSSTAATGTNASSGTSSSSAALEALFKGTATSPPTTPDPAPKGKSIYIRDCGEQVQGCNEYAAAAAAAAKALGWTSHIANANLNIASGDEKAIETAVAAHPDAIIQEGFSCSTDEPGLEQAKQAGIPVIGVETLDCSDTGGPQLFTVPMIYNTNVRTGAQWWTNFGSFAARYIVAASGGTAKLIAALAQGDPQFDDMANGFESVFKQCSGCTQLDNVSFTPATETLWPAAFRSSLVKYPSATYVFVPFDSNAVELGGAQILKESGVNAKMISGSGEAAALTLIRSGLISAEGWARDSGWMVWGAVDELVRHFDHQAPVSEGLGLVAVDATHNLPASKSSDYVSSVDYKSIYLKDWGISN